MPPVKQTTPKKTTNGKTPYASCEECGAPLDEKQRYCVSCGARRRDKGGPAVQYFANAGRRSRRGPGKATGASGARAAAVLFFVVLPIAVAIGVLVGKGNGNDNGDLASAIESLKASGGARSAPASTAPPPPIARDWALGKGYTGELKNPPPTSPQAAGAAPQK